MPGVPPSEHLPSSAFLLAGLHVDPSTGVVRGPQGEVRLEPRVMAVLEALARRPGELVTRTDLLTAIWPGGDVYDEALTQCVYQLRQQLVGVGR
jgi:DNA-binding winged helix-turn-helix (wHTH) protein